MEGGGGIKEGCVLFNGKNYFKKQNNLIIKFCCLVPGSQDEEHIRLEEGVNAPPRNCAC